MNAKTWCYDERSKIQMHLECDYTNCDSGKDLSTERTGEVKDADNYSSKKDLEIFLEYCRTRDAQFDICLLYTSRCV